MSKADEINDAMVDTYRALREINRKAAEPKPAAPLLTPGAGVDPRRVCRPSKRVRNWHRGTSTFPLKEYVRRIDVPDFAPIVAKWRANKKAAR